MKSKHLFWVGILLGWPGPLAAEEKPVSEGWEHAYLNGAKAGYVHTQVRKTGTGGKDLHTAVDLRLTFKRFKKKIELRMVTGTEETPEGKIKRVFMDQYQGKELAVRIRGTVQGKELHIVLEGKVRKKWTEAWDDRALSLSQERRQWQRRPLKKGDRFHFQSFEPAINRAVTTRVTVEGPEEIVVAGAKKRCLRLCVRQDKVARDLQVPPSLLWLDKNRNVVRSEAEVAGLGTLVLVATSRQEALGPLDEVPDIAVLSQVSLNRRIDKPEEIRTAVYRITLKGRGDVADLLTLVDARQSLGRVKGKTYELTVRADGGFRLPVKPGKIGAEFLASNPFITSADARVQELARKAVGEEKNPWKKALRIEKWVHGHMQLVVDEGAFLPASRVARTLKGNVGEHAFLAAAMCRAAGVPSRTALGMVYDEIDHKPVMRFHMWTEVHDGERWLPIDATRGRGFVGADHIKLSDHSWKDIVSLTPLLPILRVWNKVRIEVISAGAGEK